MMKRKIFRASASMGFLKTAFRGACLCFIAALGLTACALGAKPRGSLRVEVESAGARTILPANPVAEIASLVLDLDGPSSQSKTGSLTAVPSFEGLEYGSYTLSGEGRNSLGQTIARGSMSVEIEAAENPVSLSLEFISSEGFGSLDLSFRWPSAQGIENVRATWNGGAAADIAIVDLSGVEAGLSQSSFALPSVAAGTNHNIALEFLRDEEVLLYYESRVWVLKDIGTESIISIPAQDFYSSLPLVAESVISPSATSVSPNGLSISVRFSRSLDTSVLGYLEYDHPPRIYKTGASRFAPASMTKMEVETAISFSRSRLPNDTVTFTPLYGYALQEYANPKVGGFAPAAGMPMSGPGQLSHSFSTQDIGLENNLSGALSQWNDQNIYFMLTDRFNDGDATNNQFKTGSNPDYGLGDGKLYQGGDFKGIEAKLPYLQNLGVSAIWITAPVLQAWENASWTSYHGYWAQDFLALDPHLGTMQDFRDMVAAAHARGIKVIMDVVVNHTASLFSYPGASPNIWEPSFNAAGPLSTAWLTESWATEANRRPPYFGDIGSADLWTFLTRRGGNATTGSGDEITQGDFAGLRDVNTANPEVVSALGQAFTWWIANTDIDGFRIDTVKHVEAAFWEDFCADIRAWAKTNYGKDFFMIAEVYSGSAADLGSYTTSGKLDSVLGFQMANSVFDWKDGDNITVFKDSGSWASRPKTLSIESARSSTAAQSNLGTASLHVSGDGLSARQKIGYFLDNHDLNRFLNGTSGIANEAPSAGEITNLRTALAWLYSWEGIPVLYYGSEQNYKQSLALASGGEHGNGAGNVNKGNRPNLWQIANASQGNLAWNESQGTFAWIKGLNALRAAHTELRRGAVSMRWSDDGMGASNDDGIIAFTRGGSTASIDDDILVVINAHPSQYSAPSAGSGNDLGTPWPPLTVLEVIPVPGFSGTGETGTAQVDSDGGAGQSWVSETTTFTQAGKTSAVYFQLPPNSVRFLRKKP